MLPIVHDVTWFGESGSGALVAPGLTTAVGITTTSVVMVLRIRGGGLVSRWVGAGDRENADLSVWTVQTGMLLLR